MSGSFKTAGLFLAAVVVVFAAVEMARAQTSSMAEDPFGIEIERIRSVLLGSTISVSITKVHGSREMLGFDFLIGYDTHVLSFTGAAGGDIFDTPGSYEWEHFACDPDVPVPCDTGCPTGLIRVVGVGDVSNGSHVPLQYSIPDGTVLFTLHFEVTEDGTFECSLNPIDFFWIDCGDNGIAVDVPPSVGLAISDRVYNFHMQNIANPDSGFPGYFGAPDSCIMDSQLTIRLIDFYNGGFDIVCNDTLDFRGDVNLNGIPYEVADYVMFSNYFIHGLSAFGSHVEASVVASDANYDEVPLQFEDLVYLKRVIMGNANPYVGIFEHETDSAVFTQDLDAATVSVAYPDSLAGAYFIFNGLIEPDFLVDTVGHEYWYLQVGPVTNVMILPQVWGSPGEPSGFTAGPLFTYSGFGYLKEVHAANFQDRVFENRIELVHGFDGKAVIDPEIVLASWARETDTVMAAVYLGDFGQYAASDINAAALLINNAVAPNQTTLLPSHPEFTGEVLEIVFPIREVIFGYGAVHSDTDFPFCVSGQFTDGASFAVWGQWTILVHGAVLRVPSEWPTIQEALDIALSGDTILVAAGVYSGEGNRDLVIEDTAWANDPGYTGRHLVLKSENGPESSLIMCEGTASEFHRAFTLSGSYESTTIIDGFTVQGGYHGKGGAVYDFSGGPDTIRNCNFVLNEADEGGAVYGRKNTVYEYCLFFRNHASRGGAAYLDGAPGGTFINCTFTENSCSGAGAHLHVYFANPLVQNSILSFGQGEAVTVWGPGSPVFQCSDIYGNTGGDWSGVIAGQQNANGNFSKDPLYCDTTFIDFHVDGASTCVPPNNGCGKLIGAYGMRCGILCGDASNDGQVNIGDPVFIIAHVFFGGPGPNIFQAADVDTNGEIDLGDAVILINFIFRGTDAPICVR